MPLILSGWHPAEAFLYVAFPFALSASTVCETRPSLACNKRLQSVERGCLDGTGTGKGWKNSTQPRSPLSCTLDRRRRARSQPTLKNAALPQPNPRQTPGRGRRGPAPERDPAANPGAPAERAAELVASVGAGIHRSQRRHPYLLLLLLRQPKTPPHQQRHHPPARRHRTVVFTQRSGLFAGGEQLVDRKRWQPRSAKKTARGNRRRRRRWS